MDVLGIDRAKLSFDATLLLSTGAQHYASFSNTPAGFTQLEAWLGEHTITTLHACMEATHIYWEALATWLHAHGDTVSVVNPARSKGYTQATMQRNKTDKLDSAVIASFCAKHHPTPWEPQSEEQRCLRALVRLRDDLLQTQLQQENRLRDATDALVRSSLQALLPYVLTYPWTDQSRKPVANQRAVERLTNGHHAYQAADLRDGAPHDRGAARAAPVQPSPAVGHPG